MEPGGVIAVAETAWIGSQKEPGPRSQMEPTIYISGERGAPPIQHHETDAHPDVRSPCSPPRGVEIAPYAHTAVARMIDQTSGDTPGSSCDEGERTTPAEVLSATDRHK